MSNPKQAEIRQGNAFHHQFKMNKRHAAILAVLLGAPGLASAANCSWTPTSGDWGTAGDWSCNSIPGAGDSAAIGTGNIVNISAAESILNLSNAGTVNINSFLLTLAGGGATTNSGIINVGGPSTAALQVNQNINNTGGAINIGDGSVVNQFTGTITGGAISTTGSGALVAYNSGNNFLSAATLNGTLDMTSAGNARERIINGLTLNGNINIGNSGILSLDDQNTAGGNQTIGGTGNINLNDSSARLSIEGGGTTTLGAGVTVQGQGNIGQAIYNGANNTLVNNGIITANVGGTLNISNPASGSGSSLINNGLLYATNNSTLALSTNVNNNSGAISADTNSTILQNGVTLNGGIIVTDTTGQLTATNSSSNFLNASNLTGTLDLTSFGNARERIINGLTLNGVVNVANGGILTLDDQNTSGNSQTISGAGTINLNDANSLLSIEGGGTTTLGANIVVQGQGSIGQAIYNGANNTLVNDGLIVSNVTGGTLNITNPASGGGSSLINNGTLQASNDSTLILSTNITAGAGSQIIADAGSTVLQNGISINGAVGTGMFSANNSSANFLNAVSLNGTLDLTSFGNARERIVNSLTLNGNINVANGGILSLDDQNTAGGNQTISGNGSINLNDANARLSIEGGGVTTLAAGITVHGQGNIGQPLYNGANNTLVNNGLIASDAGGTLNITNPASGGGSFLINNTVVKATNNSTLELSTNVTNNGVISADTNSTILQNGVTLNGVITTDATSLLTATNSSANFLNAASFTGTLDLTSFGNARERIINGLTLNGAVNVANGGILSLDDQNTSGNNQTISGNGTINLNDAGARLSIEGGGTTTLGANIIVQGQGDIGQALYNGANNTLVNDGLILSNVAGGTLNISNPASGGGSSLTNNGTLRATNDSTLILSTNITAGAGSQIIADAGSIVLQNAITINGAVGTGAFSTNNSSANFLNAVSLNGSLDLTSFGNARERIINGLTLNGNINVANGGILSLDDQNTSGNNQTISGNGSINLNDANARLSIEGGGTTTLAAGITVHGQGNIGQALYNGANNTLVNDGLIASDAGGTLNITNPASGGGSLLVNNTVVKATNASTLVLSTNVANNGVISADTNSTILQNAVTLNGVITTDASSLFTATNSSANFLNAANFTGTLDMTSFGNARERIINGLTLNGNINVANGGILSLDDQNTSGNSQTISGTGSINLNDANAHLSIEGGGTTTLGANITVQGQGNIGSAIYNGANNNLVNNGLIDANVNGGTLTIYNPANGGGGSFTNNGVLEAGLGATLNIAPLNNFISQGTIEGTGAINGGFSDSGVILPGNIGTPGNLTINGNYTQTSGGVFNEQLGATSGLLTINGKADFNGTLALTALSGLQLSLGESITIAMISQNLTAGFFGGVTNYTDNWGDQYLLSSAAGANGVTDLNLTVTSIASVPVPGGFWLFSTGLLGLLGLRRKPKAA